MVIIIYQIMFFKNFRQNRFFRISQGGTGNSGIRGQNTRGMASTHTELANPTHSLNFLRTIGYKACFGKYDLFCIICRTNHIYIIDILCLKTFYWSNGCTEKLHAVLLYLKCIDQSILYSREKVALRRWYRGL